MPAIYLHRHRVSPEDVDRQGHVNNLSYLRWMQDAAVAHSAAQGWNTARYLESGASWVVRSHTIEYLQPSFADESIVVATWVDSFRRIRSLRKYRILREADRALLARAETLWAFVALPSHAPRALPPELVTSFEVVPDEPDLASLWSVAPPAP